MNGRDYRVEVFQDTLSIIENDEKVKSSLRKSKIKQQLFEEDFEAIFPSSDNKPNIYVTLNKTMEAGRKWAKSGNTCVMNFASATNPGGGVAKGSSAQEECLCRVSSLYACLNEPYCWENYYTPNRDEQNVLHNDKIIYTPKVIVFKDDNYKKLDSNEYFYVDVLTCAAPNLRDVPNNGWCNVGESNTPVKIDDEELYKIHLKRAKNILKVAAFNKVDNLVLGAFGCGAFRNKPEVVAKAYKEALNEFGYLFKNIEFAIFCKEYETENFDAFDEVFNG